MLEHAILVGLIREFGALSAVPRAVLRERGVRILYDEPRGIYTFLAESEYQALREQCLCTLKYNRGYIFAGDIDRIRRFLDGTQIISADDIARIRGRAKQFREEGIPPIFAVEFYAPSRIEYATYSEEGIELPRVERLFPAIDFIIQFATGAYERKRAAIGASLDEQARRHGTKRNKKRKLFIPIQPATVRDVREFRRVAFTPKGKISALLIRETLDYARKHFNFKSDAWRERALEIDHLAFLFLEETLRNLPHEPPEYASWDGTIKAVSKPKWYLRFKPEDRMRIAAAYFESLERIPFRKQDRAVYERMAATFPELARNIEVEVAKRQREQERQAIQRALDEARRKSDYSRVPEVVFVEEPWASQVIPEIEQFFRNACRRLGGESPEVLFSSVNHLHDFVAVPPRMAMIPRFKTILDEERLRAAQVIPDELFVELFSGEGGHHRYAAIGWSPWREPGDAGKNLRRFLRFRRHALGVGRKS
jgi:hypothetical protein